MPHVTFIHGIANKPAPDKLRNLWLRSLKEDILGNDDGINLGNSGYSSSMIYWADVLHKEYLPDNSVFERNVGYESVENISGNQSEDPEMSWRQNLEGEEELMIESLAKTLEIDLPIDDNEMPPPGIMDKNLERIPLPWFIKRRIMKQFLKDVHHYLFNIDFSPRNDAMYKVQDEIRNRVCKEISEGAKKGPPHIVISHSMGTVIAYDCLKRVAGCPEIDGFITIGSPLGIDEIQDKLAPEWTRENGFPEKVKGRWINVYDTFDPVTGFDGNIANDFKKNGKEVIEVINEQNEGAWRHNITNYLMRPKLRAALRNILDI